MDTGVDEEDLAFRTSRDLIKESREDHNEPEPDPVKAIKTFVGEPKKDSNGHGTQIVELLMRIAPQASFYLAKISHGISVDTTDRIADVRILVCS